MKKSRLTIISIMILLLLVAFYCIIKIGIPFLEKKAEGRYEAWKAIKTEFPIAPLAENPDEAKFKNIHLRANLNRRGGIDVEVIFTVKPEVSIESDKVRARAIEIVYENFKHRPDNVTVKFTMKEPTI